MTLLQIQYFRAVARAGNITSAADELYVSRPAISRAMGDLEKEFGIALFCRSNTGLTLTEAGCVFYKACNDIQARMDDLEGRLAQMKEERRNCAIRLGLTPLTGASIFPRFYQDFRIVCPDVQIVIIEQSHSQTRLMLEDGSMDVCLTTHTEGLSENVNSMELVKTQLLFCIAASHPLAGKKSVSIQEICDEPLVYLAEGMQREREIKKRFHQVRRTPNVVLRTGQMKSLQNIVAQGIAAGIQLHGSIDDGQSIVGIPFDPPIKFEVSVIWNRQAGDREGVKEMLSFASKWRSRL